MLTNLQRDFFAQRCTIQAPSEELDALNQPNPEDAWTDVAGMRAIPCHLAPATGGKRKTADMTVLIASHVILLAGVYAITTKMRAVVDGTAYDVLLAGYDSTGCMTRLSVRIVEW